MAALGKLIGGAASKGATKQAPITNFFKAKPKSQPPKPEPPKSVPLAKPTENASKQTKMTDYFKSEPKPPTTVPPRSGDAATKPAGNAGNAGKQTKITDYYKPAPAAGAGSKTFGEKAKGLATSTFGQVVGGTLVGSAALAGGTYLFKGGSGSEGGSTGSGGDWGGYGYSDYNAGSYGSSYGVPGSIYG